jgi:hypothetical protein
MCAAVNGCWKQRLLLRGKNEKLEFMDCAGTEYRILSCHRRAEFYLNFGISSRLVSNNPQAFLDTSFLAVWTGMDNSLCVIGAFLLTFLGLPLYYRIRHIPKERQKLKFLHKVIIATLMTGGFMS